MIKKFISRVAKGQKGFTLIEMIVVIGIIAVLAAVIVPNIGRFLSSGENGAIAAEAEAVQTAMNVMMAESSLTVVAVSASGAGGTNAWAALPTGNPIGPYLAENDTVYFYCWDTAGQLVDNGKTADVTCP